MTKVKFTSFTNCDFLNDFDLDIFIDAIEKCERFFNKNLGKDFSLIRGINLTQSSSISFVVSIRVLKRCGI